jgi:ankyrin repeat protein
MLNELKDINVIQTVNTVDGRTLLHLAAAENDDAFCEKLLKYGALVNSLMKTSEVFFCFFLYLLNQNTSF